MSNSNDDLNWINDQLHNIIGMSEAYTVNYIVAMSKKAKNKKEIYENLVDFEFPSDIKTESFSEILYSKFSLKNSEPKISDYEQRELNLIKQRNNNNSYQLIENNIKTSSNAVSKKNSEFSCPVSFS
jgi:hypothetical protein